MDASQLCLPSRSYMFSKYFKPFIRVVQKSYFVLAVKSIFRQV